LGENAGRALAKAGAHAAVGCASHAMAGGSCKAGAMSGGFGSLAGPYIPGDTPGEFNAGSMLARMAVGAIASKVGGGQAEKMVR
jgi:hypothetical protein